MGYSSNKKIPCVYMRGGTSKAVFFRDEDLPADEAQRDKVILSAFGSPDRRQIDGMGGANAATSKAAIIKKSERSGFDVDYTFAQVGLTAPVVDRTMNCGNISSAVGPYAVDEGLVAATEPITEVHIFNTNTGKEIVSLVPVKNGRALTEGDFTIENVPGSAAKVTLKFVSPQGGASGKLLPAGKPSDTIVIDGKRYKYSFVDAGNPVIFVRPEDFGVTGSETPSEFTVLPNHAELCRILEVIRGTGAVLLGLAKDLEDARLNSQTLPKIAFVSTPGDYTTIDGTFVAAKDFDIAARVFTFNTTMMDAFMGTGAICIAAAANVAGSIVNEIVCGNGKHPDNRVTSVRIGHPSGIMYAGADLKDEPDGSHSLYSGNLDRTARRIMEGYVYVRD